MSERISNDYKNFLDDNPRERLADQLLQVARQAVANEFKIDELPLEVDSYLHDGIFRAQLFVPDLSRLVVSIQDQKSNIPTQVAETDLSSHFFLYDIPKEDIPNAYKTPFGFIQNNRKKLAENGGTIQLVRVQSNAFASVK